MLLWSVIVHSLCVLLSIFIYIPRIRLQGEAESAPACPVSAMATVARPNGVMTFALCQVKGLQSEGGEGTETAL